MRLIQIATAAVAGLSLVSGSAFAAAPVRASDSILASAPQGAATRSLMSVRASKKTGEDQALLGAPLFLLFLGAVVITIGTIVIVNNGGGNNSN